MQHSTTNGIFLLLGTNLGDRLENLAAAKGLIASRVGKLKLESSIYLTKAWGNTDQPDFLNQVIGIETSIQPEMLLEAVLKIEKELGRIREQKWGPRTIDIDILFYNDLVIQSPTLIIPHPALHQRRFTLTPLAEIAPAFEHPILKQNVSRLLETCDDKQAVTLFVPENN